MQQFTKSNAHLKSETKNATNPVKLYDSDRLYHGLWPHYFHTELQNLNYIMVYYELLLSQG